MTIVIPIYNTEKYIKKCLDSILEQTYEAYEIIIIDDGSTDGSSQICDTYAKKNKKIRVIHTKNNGAYVARKIAIENAQGDCITFVDSDDWIEKDMLEELVKLMEKEDADLSVIMRKSGDRLDDHIKIGNGAEMLLYLLNIGCIELWGKLYKKSLFEQIKYRERRANEDLNMLPEIVFGCNKIVVHTLGKYNYRNRDNSITTSVIKNGGKSLCDCCLEGIRKNENRLVSSEFRLELQKWYFYHILWHFYNVYCVYNSKKGLNNIASFYRKTFTIFWRNNKIKISDKFRFSFIAYFPNCVRKYNFLRYGKKNNK